MKPAMPVAPRNQHVVLHDGSWVVQDERSGEITTGFPTKQDAIDAAQELADRLGSKMIVHGREGQAFLSTEGPGILDQVDETVIREVVRGLAVKDPRVQKERRRRRSGMVITNATDDDAVVKVSGGPGGTFREAKSAVWRLPPKGVFTPSLLPPKPLTVYFSVNKRELSGVVKSENAKVTLRKDGNNGYTIEVSAEGGRKKATAG